MRCFQCGKKIGYFRSFADQQYCCAEHRKEARLASAQALRDEEDTEFWSVARSRRTARRSTGVAGPIASVFAILIAGVVLVAVMTMGPGAGAAVPRVSLDPGVKRGLFERAGDAIGEAIRSSAPVTLHHDFQSGWADWTAIRLRSAPKARAVSLRIWNRSTALRNYQMDFSGQIEKKSLSWVFRATDENNYYATKLLIAQPGKLTGRPPGLLPNAGLIRYVVMDGREWDRVQLPLPLTLERGGTFRVRVSVDDDRFITYVNGQLISSWTDQRLRRGGVGFFSDDEDPQQVAWVSLSERDSVLGRVLAHFSWLIMPISPRAPAARWDPGRVP